MPKKEEDARNRWQREHQERLTVMVEKGQKDKIKAHAIQVGAKSLNSYIVGLIEADMERATPDRSKDL